MSEPLESHGYQLDFDALYARMWDLAREADDGSLVYISEGDQAIKWLVAELSGTPAESGVTLDANDGLRQEVYRVLEDEAWAERSGQRTFRLLREPEGDLDVGDKDARHILCTWNPGGDNSEQYTPEEWDEFVDNVDEALASDEGILGRWSVGRRVRGIDEGDVAYLLRQGVHGRGIVASGEIQGRPYSDKGFRDGQKSAQYIDVLWTFAVPLDDMLPVEELIESVPGVPWNNLMSSGIEAKGETGRRLWDVWMKHLGGDDPDDDEEDPDGGIVVVVEPGGRPVGAGFGSAEQNARVEVAAMKCVIDAYDDDEWDVDDVSKDKVGWDVTFTKGGEVHHVEIKGVAGSKTECFVTANELSKAREMSTWRLAIVTNALIDPTFHDVDREVVIENASPSIYRVKLAASAFE